MSDVLIRWMVRNDLREVMEIEQLCHQFPLTEEQLVLSLRNRSTIALVAVESKPRNGRGVLGFVVYELHKQAIELHDLAVHPCVQRRGVGSLLISKLIDKLGSLPRRRSKLIANVIETNLEAQLFFKAMEFKATNIVRKSFADDCDAYQMQYAIRVPELV